MEFLAWKMLVITLYKQYAFDRLNIKMAFSSIHCTCINEKILAACALCEGNVKKN
jgi:hypothetical protein